MVQWYSFKNLVKYFVSNKENYLILLLLYITLLTPKFLPLRYNALAQALFAQGESLGV